MTHQILIWRDQLEGDKEDCKRCKVAAVKRSLVGAGEVTCTVRGAEPTCCGRMLGVGERRGGAFVEFHMDTSQLAENNG